MKKGEVCIVSGGSKGLGGSISGMLLEQGVRVAAFSRRRTPEVDDFYAKYGEENFYWASVDLGNKDALEEFVNDVESKFGQIDGLVNNAAVYHQAPFLDSSFEDIQRLTTVNSQSVIYLTLLVAKKMEPRGKGVIVNISSITALHPSAGNVLYGGTKGSITSITMGLAQELAPKGIRVNGIMPGFMLTDMTKGISEEVKTYLRGTIPARKLAEAADVAAVALFLLSDAARYVYGQNIAVDGGVSL